MRSTLVDTGPLVALFDKADAWHLTVTEFLAGHPSSLMTSWPVLTEVHYMLKHHMWLDVLEWIEQGGVQVADVPAQSFRRLSALSRKYRDLPMDFADATLVLLAELHDQPEIITIDSDFDVYRFGPNRPFRNLLGDRRRISPR